MEYKGEKRGELGVIGEVWVCGLEDGGSEMVRKLWGKVERACEYGQW